MVAKEVIKMSRNFEEREAFLADAYRMRDEFLEYHRDGNEDRAESFEEAVKEVFETLRGDEEITFVGMELSESNEPTFFVTFSANTPILSTSDLEWTAYPGGVLRVADTDKREFMFGFPF